ncbi:MAG: hypothetical protein HZC22_11280 [Rhodocyclales bacterium]|nr:hypothetical protein [Rhodocyclales bacterium]
MFPGRGYNELKVGEEFASTMTLTETHIVLGAGLFGDFNPLHVNESFGKGTRFGGRIAHGYLMDRDGQERQAQARWRHRVVRGRLRESSGHQGGRGGSQAAGEEQRLSRQLRAPACRPSRTRAWRQ